MKDMSVIIFSLRTGWNKDILDMLGYMKFSIQINLTSSFLLL